MSISRVSCVGIAVAVASITIFSEHAYADNPFRFSPFSSSSTTAHDGSVSKEAKNRNEEDPKGTTSRGFDPESLERGAKALREINSSPYAKQVFEVMRKQEEARLTELEAERAQFQAV